MGLNLRRVGLLAGKMARALARLVELTPARVDMLFALEEKERTQVDLAAQLCVSSPVVSRMLAVLEERELVIRTPRSGDRRYRLVFLTDKARALLEGLRGRWIEGMGDVQTRAEIAWTVEWGDALGRVEFDYMLPEVSVKRLLRGMQRRNRATDYLAYFRAGRWPPPARAGT